LTTGTELEDNMDNMQFVQPLYFIFVVGVKDNFGFFERTFVSMLEFVDYLQSFRLKNPKS